MARRGRRSNARRRFNSKGNKYTSSNGGRDYHYKNRDGIVKYKFPFHKLFLGSTFSKVGAHTHLTTKDGKNGTLVR